MLDVLLVLSVLDYTISTDYKSTDSWCDKLLLLRWVGDEAVVHYGVGYVALTPKYWQING